MVYVINRPMVEKTRTYSIYVENPRIFPNRSNMQRALGKEGVRDCFNDGIGGNGDLR